MPATYAAYEDLATAMVRQRSLIATHQHGLRQTADSVSIQQFNRQAMRRTQNVQLWRTRPMGCALIAA